MPRPPRPIFTERWQAGLARAIETAMPSVIRIYRNDGDPVYDPATNTYTSPTIDLYAPVEGVVGSGKARIQPLRSARYDIAPMDSSYVQTVLVSIPIAAAQGLDFRTSDKVQVLESPLNTVNTKYQYVINELLDSSNPFERTLLCTVNLETRVEGP